MNPITLVHEIVSRLRSRRNQTQGGAQAASSDSEMLSEPTTWHTGQELQERADEIERVDPRVQITGSKRGEWIEGQGVEVRR